MRRLGRSPGAAPRQDSGTAPLEDLLAAPEAGSADGAAAGPSCAVPATVPAVVHLRALARAYPGTPPVQALRGVDLVVQAGEYVSVTGPSGSGKSTLLHVLGLLDRPTDGDFLLDGIPTAGIPEDRRAVLRGRQIGFVFQQFHLLPNRTVLDNVLLAMLYSAVPRAERDRRARAALDRVRLGHRMTALPSTLSGGERQRVAIARAVAAGPSLLLADEPTGNLDTANSAGVMDLFDELHADGMTLIVITHDPAVSARAQRLVRISDGLLEPA